MFMGAGRCPTSYTCRGFINAYSMIKQKAQHFFGYKATADTPGNVEMPTPVGP
jgi:hypothetical protein